MTLQEQIKEAIQNNDLELARKLLEAKEKELEQKAIEQVTNYSGSTILKNKRVNKFNDDGTEAVSDKDIDKKLWEGRKPVTRGRDAVNFINHNCHKCGKSFQILPSQLTGIDKKKFICNTCGANPS